MAEKSQQLKKVTLLKPHTHAGVKYRAGDLIEVDPAVAVWLEKNGVTATDAQVKTDSKDKA